MSGHMLSCLFPIPCFHSNVLEMTQFATISLKGTVLSPSSASLSLMQDEQGMIRLVCMSHPEGTSATALARY